MAENFKCTGNCLNCLPAQRAYCSSQHSYSNMKVLDAMMAEVLGMKENIKVLSEKIEAIQSNEASVFDPNTGTPVATSVSPTSIAQSGEGAESRIPETM